MNLEIIASATAAIGAGHVMRSVPVAQAWMSDGRGQAWVRGEVQLPFVAARLASLGIPVIAPNRPAPQAALVLVDSYERDDWDRARKGVGEACRILVDDQGVALPEGFRGIWRPLPFAPEGAQPPGHVRWGADVVVARDDLPTWSPPSGGDTVAVMLGGGRPEPGVAEAVEQYAAGRPRGSVAVVGAWGAAHVTRLPADEPWRDVVQRSVLVTAAGTTLWEAAAVHMPVVVLGLVDNQDDNARWASAAGVPVAHRRETSDAAWLARFLADAVPRARPAPPLPSGPRRIVEWLAEQAREAAVS